MTRCEVKQLLVKINTIYPDTDHAKSDEALAAKLQMWADLFVDDPPELVYAAVKAYIASSPESFAPNPGQIKDKMYRLLHANDPSEAEAWAIVLKSLRNSLYNSVDEFGRLPAIVQKAVGAPGQLREWAMLSGPDSLSVAEALFKKTYRIECQREAERAKIPMAIRVYIAALETPIVKAIDAPRKEAKAQDTPSTINRAALEAVKKSLNNGITAGSENDFEVDASRKEAAIEKLKQHIANGNA